jgi:hypothetical protein
VTNIDDFDVSFGSGRNLLRDSGDDNELVERGRSIAAGRSFLNEAPPKFVPPMHCVAAILTVDRKLWQLSSANGNVPESPIATIEFSRTSLEICQPTSFGTMRIPGIADRRSD